MNQRCSLLQAKAFPEAEPLLRAGYEGMKQREKSIPPQGATRIPEALDRLLDLCTATSRPDEVKKWQAERAKYPEAKKPETKKNESSGALAAGLPRPPQARGGRDAS